MAPTISEALAGGFSTFFSVWQLCIMQITPFFLAFYFGSYSLLDRGKNLLPMLMLTAGLTIGFSVVFALMSVPAIGLGSLILRNLKDLKFFAGVFIMAVGLLMVLFAFLNKFNSFRVLAVLSPLVGVSLAIAYSPCIAPELSKILNYSSIPSNSHRGLSLLFMYGAGLCIAAALVGVVLIIVFKVVNSGGRKKRRPLPTVIASLVFMIIGVLLLTGLMFRYKMILVNLF